jgi:signal transduction histidine kinase
MSDNSGWLENLRFVAHEMRTPIGAVRGFIELVENLGPLNDEQMAFLERVVQTTQRMDRLVDVLLEAARIDSGKPLQVHECDFASVIQHEVQLLEPMARQLGINVSLNADPDTGLVRVDAERVGHVVSNLVSNAIKYNQEGGQVWVEVHGDDQHVYLDVRDTGRGIAPEAAARIYERFYRAHDGKRKVEGVGLGLYIAKSLTELHGGSLDFESEVGIGTTFHLVLPRDTVPVTDIETARESIDSEYANEATGPLKKSGAQALR